MTNKRSYNNPWIPVAAMDILSEQKGTIIDVGGGAAPYHRATHVLDILPFDADRLESNAWGGDDKSSVSGVRWTEEQYTQLDVCECGEWPFKDRSFDLGLSSHCLEDLRDPIPAVRELARVCRKILIIAPSRLLEQTRGIDHPKYCGFPHHPWIVTARGERLVFRRKTMTLMLPGCHIVCPPGKTLPVDQGSMFYYGQPTDVREDSVVWKRDYEDFRDFVQPYRGCRDLFIHDGRKHGIRFWIWQFRQRFLGAV